MKIKGIKNPAAELAQHGLRTEGTQYWNLLPEELVEHTLCKGMGQLADTGALVVATGRFTGRSPLDRFVVKDARTADSVDWGKINIPFAPEDYRRLRQKMAAWLADKDLYIRDVYACADARYRLRVRAITQLPWSNQFVHNMFIRPSREELAAFEPEWTVISAPGFEADPAVDGTRQRNFAIINFSEREILIGGTAYTGEIKKGIFSVLNFVLPHDHGVLSMHCSANVGREGDVAVFFGLSGTGKTTLSADPQRYLIGDDEHGWSDQGVFNFEGGCYAKVIDLSAEQEPDIWNAIRHGALLENVRFFEGTRTVNYADGSVTENTRVSYPIHHIRNARIPGVAGHPKHIFFLTYDAFGVLPPIARLSKGQAMYHFISGYTAKVAGTEDGVTEPKATFSACFGAPFMPLHPTRYAEMLGRKMEQHDVRIWLVNTGLSGGPYGQGKRMKLAWTRAMITAAMEGALERVPFKDHPVFGVAVPQQCPSVPAEVLDPRSTWPDAAAYDRKAAELAAAFAKNFDQFRSQASDEILAGGPRVMDGQTA